MILELNDISTKNGSLLVVEILDAPEGSQNLNSDVKRCWSKMKERGCNC